MSIAPRPRVSGVALSVLTTALNLDVGNAIDTDPLITGITHDSRQVQSGDLYAALPGFNTHGSNFVEAAKQSGAVAIFTDPIGVEAARAVGLPIVVAAHPRAHLGALADMIYEHPSRDLVVIGITGTKGNTTTSYLLDSALRAAGLVTGVIGTVGTRIGDEFIPTSRTTPEATDVHALLALMRERGVKAVSMEVSSHALRLGRVDDVQFASVCFTNLTEDHLDFHTDMNDYFDAKASLFSIDRAERALVCTDDEWGRTLAHICVERGLPVSTYGLMPPAATIATSIAPIPGGSEVTVGGLGGGVHMTVHLPGEFNVVNALGAMACAMSIGVDAAVAGQGISACGGVPGRMERVIDPRTVDGVIALVDYAHTPDAVERAISAVRTGTAGRIVVVLGAGGDRDQAKRPLMGAAAARLADVVIVTDDNPRSEAPETIRASVLRGALGVRSSDVFEVADRQGAIARAVECASGGDVVLVLGKGHEQGQEVNGVTTPFDDREVLAQALAAAKTARTNEQGAGE